jgi:starch synthase (maltosyl-transferring)
VKATRERVSIQRVSPEVLGGRYPAKATAGRPVDVLADIVSDSHDVLAAVVRWKDEDGTWTEVPMHHVVNDRWTASFVPPHAGRYRFTVLAWVDHVATWRRDLAKKAEAGTVEPIDLAVGASLLDDLAGRAKGANKRRLQETSAALTDPGLDLATRVDAGLSDELADLTTEVDPRRYKVRYRRTLELRVDRERAAFSTWYELFPRSTVSEPGRHGTFRDVIDRLGHVADMGFDVLYLPPIHPIGRDHRKGRNNASPRDPDDPGSPWAIGSAEGGHTAIHPQLGTIEDFRALVSACRDHGLELALDIAFQCSPDHPWVREHPEWFRSARTGRSSTRRTRPRSTRTSTRSTSRRPTRRGCGRRSRASSTTGSPRGCGSSGWTTRTPSRSPSGSGASTS